MSRITFTISILLLIYVSAAAKIIKIPADKVNIQDGIDLASNSDTVLVSPGSYFENIVFPNKNITVGSWYLLSGDTSYISRTIIDGNAQGSVLKFENTGAARIYLIGFTVQHGSGTRLDDQCLGGGIFCRNASPIISNNLIQKNSAINPLHLLFVTGAGGGIYAENSAIQIEANTFIQNYAQGHIIQYSLKTFWGQGGAIALKYPKNCLVKNNRIIQNETPGIGGGIYGTAGTIQIIGNLIQKNQAFGDYGSGLTLEKMSAVQILDNQIESNNLGGIALYHCNSGRIMNNLICRNKQGSGMIVQNSKVDIMNNTITQNSHCIIGEGGGIQIKCSNVRVVNNIIACNENVGIWSNENQCHLRIAFNSFWEQPVHLNYFSLGDWGQNQHGVPCDSFFNIYVNPAFVAFPDNLRLSDISPCINAGDPDTCGCGLPKCDIEKKPRILNKAIDIGAYEQDFSSPVSQKSASSTKHFSLSQNYPNPFNAATTIEFTLPQSGFVTLKVYNLLGEEVATLIAEPRVAGIHQVNWDARELASGVYLYRLETGEFVQAKKLIFLP